MSDLELINFETMKEEWNKYKLKDGSIIEIKLVLLKVLKHRDKLDDVGYPIYTVQTHNVLNVTHKE